MPPRASRPPNRFGFLEQSLQQTQSPGVAVLTFYLKAIAVSCSLIALLAVVEQALSG
jgi:hypothetical protein